MILLRDCLRSYIKACRLGISRKAKKADMIFEASQSLIVESTALGSGQGPKLDVFQIDWPIVTWILHWNNPCVDVQFIHKICHKVYGVMGMNIYIRTSEVLVVRTMAAPEFMIRCISERLRRLRWIIRHLESPHDLPRMEHPRTSRSWQSPAWVFGRATSLLRILLSLNPLPGVKIYVSDGHRKVLCVWGEYISTSGHVQQPFRHPTSHTSTWNCTDTDLGDHLTRQG